MSESADLDRYLQRRRLVNYERNMARLSYAYGVDVRRSRWLASSTVGNSLVRAIDRRWPRLAEELLQSEVSADASVIPTPVLERIGQIRQMLRAPLPTLRVLTPEARASGNWPLVTPLGPTHGDVHWLILDVEGLSALPAGQVDFLLGMSLGHLHCEHGVFFTGHLLAGRDKPFGAGAIKRAISPWSKVMSFSADRAGMLAVSDLEIALESLRARTQADDRIDWLPRWPSLELREQALREFDQSVVMARLRAMKAAGNGDELHMFETILPAEPSDEGSQDSDSKATSANAKKAPSASNRVGPIPKVGIPADAWSLARCDERLTHRLRLL